MAFPPPGTHPFHLQNLLINMPGQYQIPPMSGIIPIGLPPAQMPQTMGNTMGITVPTGVATISAPPIRKVTPEIPPAMLIPQMIPQININQLDLQNNQKKPATGPVITVFVGNITERASDMLIRQLLSKCGTVNNWKRVQGANGKLQGFGFCDYSDAESAMRAIRLLHEFDVADKKLVVKVDPKAKEKLDEYVKENNPNASSSDMDTVDEDTKKEDESILKQLEIILKEHEIELSRDPDPNRDRNRRSDKRTGDPGKSENLADIEMEEEKRSLIHREIYKFRDTYKAIKIK